MRELVRIDSEAGGALRIELPPSRTLIMVGLILEVAFTSAALLALMAPNREAPALLLVLAWAAAFSVIEYLRHGRQQLHWEPRRRRLSKRVLLKRGHLPFSERTWTLSTTAVVSVVPGRGSEGGEFWFVQLSPREGAAGARVFWTRTREAADAVASRVAEAIAAP